MGSIVRQSGKYKAVVRKKGHRHIYEIFDKLSDARSFINRVESEIQQKKFKDISEAANTSLRTVLHRYIREKLQNKKDKKRERSKFNVILRHDIVKRMLEVQSSTISIYGSKCETTYAGLEKVPLVLPLDTLFILIKTRILAFILYLLSQK